MEKSKLEKFITKYNLNGACESVSLVSDGNTLSVSTVSGDKNILVSVTADDMAFPEGKHHIYETKKFRSMLSVMDENIVVTPSKKSASTGLSITDGNTTATFVLAEESVITEAPKLKAIPPTEFTINIDEKFINTFIRAKSALNDVDTFALVSTGEDTTASLVIGYSNRNTNRITVKANTDKAVKIDTDMYSANLLREILNANKDVPNGVIRVTKKGMLIAEFLGNGFTSRYYLVHVDDAE